MKKHLDYDPEMRTFMKDQDIENAYQMLKPLIDNIHEEFITSSMESNGAKSINFTDYFNKFKEKKDDKGERELRIKIGELYKFGETAIRRKYQLGWKWDKKKSSINKKNKLEWKVGGKEKKGAEIMKSQDILYAAAISGVNIEEEKLRECLKHLEGFFTYFSGFNQNRENYYTTKDEKATAVATRIVHKNLPKFCDNSLLFNGYFKKKKNGKKERIDRKDEYLNAYKYLKDKKRITQIKDAETNKMIEAYPIEKKYFDIYYFNSCLSQRQIEEYNRMIGHYNLLINLYNQARISEEKSLDKNNRKFKKLSQFKTLYKQIGCGKRNSLFFALKYDKEADIKKEDRKEKSDILSVEKVLELASQAGKKYFTRESNNIIVKNIPEFVDWLKENHNDWSGIYWSSKAINTISNKYFANWYSVIELIQNNYKEYDNVATYNKQREQQVKLRDAVELEGLFDLLDKSVKGDKENWWEVFFKKSVLDDKQKMEIIKNWRAPSQALMELLYFDIEENSQKFNEESKNILKLDDYKKDKNKKKIKKWMDYGLSVNQMLKYFLVNENKCKGNSLNSDLVNILDTITKGEKEEVDWFKWYDGLRNYLTKKPQDDVKENKLKLNFLNSTLAGGWDFNKESANSCVILKDNENRKYLAVMRRGYNKVFEKKRIERKGKNKHFIKNPLFNEDGEWSKMEYKQIAAPTGIGGFVRKCFNTAQNYGWRCPNDCLNKEGKIIIKNEEAKNILTKLIDCYKDFFNKYEKDGFKYKDYNFQFKPSNEYENVNEFFSDVKNQGYKISFINISKIELDTLVKDEKIYLFEIKNQDSNNGKKIGHKQNLHTIYWNSIFGENEGRPKLDGKAELFYRPAVPIDKMEIVKDENGNELRNKKGKKILKNFRFSKEKFLFHCPITLYYREKNYSKPEYAFGEINNHINDNFQNQEIYFLGLDRGEKHLIYYSLVDKNGTEVKERSLNLPFKDKNGNSRSILRTKQIYNKIKQEWESKKTKCWNYNDLLDAVASNRDEARKNWQTIGNIKNLKEGYISQVVHKIVKKSITKPTFIILEDLNTEFKRGRQKIEKQVYQKFEVALAKKLNFVVNKDAKEDEISSATKAIQLTPPVQNYGDIENKKQVGIMFYTRANYTSQTDPLTGWRKTIYLKRGSEKFIREQIGEKFNDIGFENGDYFFSYTDKQGKNWKLWSGKNGKSLLRYRGKRDNKNIWTTENFCLNKMLNGIFKGFDKSKSLYSQIFDDKKELSRLDNKLTQSHKKYTAWESLRFIIDLIQQIRNSGDIDKGQDDNFLFSPVRDKKTGEHFDSRKQMKGLPKDADANGAYNIARKGIIMNEHIRQWEKDGKKKNSKGNDLDLFISDEEWDLWLNHKFEWEKMLPTFSSRNAMADYRRRRK